MRTKTKEVVNYLITHPDLEGENVSPMKLQKLLYFAHGWYLAFTGKPLIFENIEAWRYGPVIASVYYHFKPYGNQPIHEPVATYDEQCGDMVIPTLDDAEAKHIIDQVIRVYGKEDAIKLSTMTHLPDSPWSKYWRDDPYTHIIDQKEIERYFRDLGTNNDDTARAEG